MATEEFGELIDLPLKEVWEHEALHFTPWLAKNLDRLSDILGVEELELEGTEVAVRSYRADIVCRDPQDGTRVVIENQLGRANSQHLGQTLVYLAGLEDARIAVWIAREFREVHLDALRWLNKHTADRFSFFAVELSAVKIGNSLTAPVLKSILGPEELTSLGSLRRDFWSHLAERLPDAPRLKAGYAGGYVRHQVDECKVSITQYIASDGVGLFVRQYKGESKKSMLTRLEPILQRLREELEEASKRDGRGEINDHTFGSDTDSGYPCSIRLSIDTRDPNNWDQMADWLDDRRKIYEKVLRGDPSQVG